MVGVNEVSKQKDVFSIYPNPANDKITIELTNPEKENEIRLFNAMGQAVYEGTTGNSTTEIDLSSLASGIYLVKINNSVSQKLVIEK